MFGLSKLYSMGIIVVVAIAAIGGIWLHGRSTGYDIALAEQAAAQKEQLRQDAKAVTKIEKKQKVRKKVIAKAKAKIRTVTDKGCYKLDEPLPVAHVNKLRDAYKQLEKP